MTDCHNETVLEQWKFYAETTLETSRRRMKNNRFYIKLLLGLITGIGIGAELDIVASAGILLAGAIGFLLCILWYFSIKSYQQLNSGKYRVLGELAQELPYSPHHREWKELKKGNDKETYIPHTSVEFWLPRVTAFPFALMIIYGGLESLNLSTYLREGIIALMLISGTYYLSILLGNSTKQILSSMTKNLIEDLKERKNGIN